MKHTYPTHEVRALPEPHAVPAPLPRFYVAETRYPDGRKRPVVFTYVREDGCLFESAREASLAMHNRALVRVKALPMTVAPIPAPPRKKVYTLGITGRTVDEVAEAKARAERLAKQVKAKPVTCRNRQPTKVVLPKAPCPNRAPLPVSNQRVMDYDLARLAEKREAKRIRQVKAKGIHNPITLGRGPLPAYLMDDYAHIDPRVIAMIR